MDVNLREILLKKIQRLSEFLNINEKEVKNLSSGDFSNLEFFYDKRESLLRDIQFFDESLGKATKNSPNVLSMDFKEKENIRKLFKEKDDLVKRILDKDLQILGFVEDEKNRIIHELNETRVTKSAMKAYRATNGRN